MTLAKDTNLSRSTIKRSLDTLEKMNVIHSIKGRSGKTYSINQLFIKNCATCHSVQKGDKTLRAGPNLWGVFGRKAAAQKDYTMYSDAIKNSGLIWNDENLDKWLTNSGGFMPGTNMYYMQADASVRQTIIDYLKTLK